MGNMLCYAIPKEITSNNYGIYVISMDNFSEMNLTKEEAWEECYKLNEKAFEEEQQTKTALQDEHVYVSMKNGALRGSLEPLPLTDLTSIDYVIQEMNVQKEFLEKHQEPFHLMPWYGKLICSDGTFTWNENLQVYEHIEKTS